MITQTRGVQLVEQHIHKVVSFRAWNTNMDELAKSMIFLQHTLLVEILITHTHTHTHTEVNKDCLKPYGRRLLSVLL